MSEICERDQINEEIQYRAVHNLERTEQSKFFKSGKYIINLMILRFQNFWSGKKLFGNRTRNEQTRVWAKPCLARI
jgi:hypothetical protein